MEFKDRRFLLLDLETTGFDEKKHQILEVGMLILENGKIIDSLEIKIKHKEYLVTPGAMKANKIDLLKHDEEAIDTKNAAINILDFLRKNKSEDKFIVVGQNINFDIKFIEEMFLKEWKIKDFRELVSYRVLDIMQLAMIRNLEGKIKLEKQDLDTILNTLEIPIPETRHSAITDCKLEFEVLKKLFEYRKIWRNKDEY